MKKRNAVLTAFPLLLAATLATSWSVLRWQNEKFEETLRAEARDEAKNRLETTLEFFRPLLEANDWTTLERYCKTFDGDRRGVAVFDARGAAIVASDSVDLTSPLDAPDVAEALRSGRGFATRRDKRTGGRTAAASAALQIRATTQIVRVVVPVEEESKALRGAEAAAFALLLASPVALAALGWFLVRRVAVPFDRLQRSAERIAAGALDVDVEIPDAGVVRELATSVSEMARRLQKEVETVRRQEKFRRDFIANVSHEIKTPLTGISSAVQILDDGGWSNPVYLAKCREILAKQTRRLQALVRDVLSLAELERREETNASDVDFERVAFDEIVGAATRLRAETTAESEGAPVWTRRDSAVVFGDARLLEQAATNLLTNAAKYGGPTPFEVALEVRDGFATFSVRDFGPGVPDDASERIFERFYRIRKEYGRRPDGTGLGLAIVRRIATLHRGSVRLEKVDGPGAKFALSIPLAPPIFNKEENE